MMMMMMMQDAASDGVDAEEIVVIPDSGVCYAKSLLIQLWQSLIYNVLEANTENSTFYSALLV